MPQTGDYDKLASGGEYNGDEYSYFDVYIYPNTSSEENTAETDVADAIINFAEILVGGDEVSFYNIYLSNNYPDINESNPGDYLSEFRDWIQDSNREYDKNEGSHLAVSDNFESGKAYQGYSNDSAYTTGKAAVMGTTGSTPYMQNGVIQEVCHNYLIEDVISSYTGNDDNDHDLGTVTKDDQLVTPMATSYVGPHRASTTGQCRSNYWTAAGYTTEPTYCTTDAMDLVANTEVD